MSTLQNSIEYIDESLDIGFKELNTFLDNNVYSVRKDIEETIFGYINSALGTLRSITGKIRDTFNAIMAIPQKIMNEIQKIIDRVMNELLSFNFGGWVGYVVTELKLISQQGVKEFLLGATAAGSVVLCANLDVLQDLIDGFKIPENILEGLLMGLSLDWMNRICKDISHREEMNMSNKEKLESVYPYGGYKPGDNDVVPYFSGVIGGFLDAKNGYVDPKLPIKDKEFFTVSIEGKKSIFEIQKEMGDIETMEQKNTYMGYLNEMERAFYEERTKKRSDSGISEAEMRCLELRGEIARTEPIKRERLIQKNNFGNAKDVLGSFIKTLKDIDLDKIHVHKLDATEKEILKKLYTLQKLSNEVSYLSRSHGKNQYFDLDYDSILAVFTEEELKYMEESPRVPQTGRYNGLHPTTEMFIKDEVYYTPKNDFNPVGI